MELRMWTNTATAGEDCIPLIKKSIKATDGFNVTGSFKFIGFEGDSGTEFYLNDSKEPMKIPNCGYFITPFDGQRGMGIWSLKFKETFTGDIYYIIG